MLTVPRELFVPPWLAAEAYDDTPLPIGSGQTISQPYIVAFMIEALGLRGGEKVLEIGAGSGYAAAVLAQIAGDVYTIERIGELAARANENLANAGYQHVHVRHADGTQGWAEQAPFDAILVSASTPDVPSALLHQLKIGGRMVIPVGDNRSSQELVRITRMGEEDFEQEDIADVRFVPLIGD
jgi:protein-L-isoaspartate(D-aspartate) O-methyltransferase